MTKEIFSNNATSTLGSAVAPTDTTITLAVGSGSIFPSIGAGQYFTVTIFAAGSTTGTPNEIVRVTARTGDTLTVVRGQEGTPAQSWAVGDTCANYPTADWFNSQVSSTDLQLQSGNSAVDTGTANAGAVTLSPAITDLSQVLYAPIRVKKVGYSNTGAYTLNVNGLGAKSVKVQGTALAAGMLVGSQVFEVSWNGTDFTLISTPAALPNALLAPMPANTVKGNVTGATAQPTDIPLSQLANLLGIVGMVAPFAMPSAPDGWLFCDGSAVSRTTYANLFARIGTYWGAGDGSTTFNLPDYRGVFIRGYDAGRGFDPGRVFGSFQYDELRAHSHHIAAGNFEGGADNVTNGDGSIDDDVITRLTGGSETRPVNNVGYICIKY